MKFHQWQCSLDIISMAKYTTATGDRLVDDVFVVLRLVSNHIVNQPNKLSVPHSHYSASRTYNHRCFTFIYNVNVKRGQQYKHFVYLPKTVCMYICIFVYRQALAKCGCIDIKQKAGCLSHLDDPDRLKSLLAQTLTTEQYTCWKIDVRIVFIFFR